ncbi:MAG TPA: hypothetical protein VFW90_01890 [Candidatus Saccharimonadales bacterium]|nr:hypothetical protein [Candidatus Saccharimonadales bacterium]
MKRVSGGYTILEVMIFLVVSLTLLAAAIKLVSGKQSEVTFDQSVRDIQSKLNDWINDVSTGFPGGDVNQLNCTAAPNSRPVINNTGPNVEPDCIFLGKAIQFTTKDASPTQDGLLYVYSVFGNRLHDGVLPANLSEASPAPAVGRAGTGNADLTESFSLGSAYVKTVCAIPVGSNICTSSHLIGFFSTFNTENTTTENGSEDINAFQFRFNGGDFTPRGDALVNCLELRGGCGLPLGLPPEQWPEKFGSFKICLSDDKHSAQITIQSVNGVGASTKLDYITC